MARSSNSARAERINTALEFLRQCETLAEAAQALVQAYGMSKRQAYRYLREAQMQGEPVPIPERKVAFTVKLPEGVNTPVTPPCCAEGAELEPIRDSGPGSFFAQGPGTWQLGNHASMRFDWNTPLIDCDLQNWHRRINSWYSSRFG